MLIIFKIEVDSFNMLVGMNNFDLFDIFSLNLRVSAYILLLNLLVRKHHRNSSAKNHKKSVAIVAVFIDKIAFFIEFVFKALNHVKINLIMKVFMLEKIHIPQKIIDLKLIDLSQGNLHFSCNNLDDAFNSELIARICFLIDRGKPLLLSLS